MKLRAMLLDLDGTLIDSNDQHVTAWQTALRDRDHFVDDDVIRRGIGKGGDHLIRDVLGDAIERAQGDELREAQGRAYIALAARQHIRVMNGARELIDACKAHGLLVALATSSSTEHLDATEKSCGVHWRAEVDVAVGGDDIDHSKPSPDVVTTAATKLGVATRECALLGDTIWDVMSARRAGAIAFALASATNPATALRDAGAAEVFASLDELVADLDNVIARARIAH